MSRPGIVYRLLNYVTLRSQSDGLKFRTNGECSTQWNPFNELEGHGPKEVDIKNSLNFSVKDRIPVVIHL